MNQISKNTDRFDKVSISDKPVIRIIFVIGGFLFVGIGIIGMFLPLLPTTVFFLLAAWCFARSSNKFYNWLHNNKLFGKYLKNYRTGLGMTIKSKIFSILFLWIGIMASIIWGTDIIYIRILLVAIALGVSWHILSIKTYKGT